MTIARLAYVSTLENLVYCNDAVIVEVPDENAGNVASDCDTENLTNNQLALRLVAAEQSLLDEIQQHYGNGPYTEDVDIWI
jgi:hypothetical protein